MSSIMTNAAAMTALQTLKQTNKNMDITQNRISTGFRVSEAAHNAAYWSIATTMRSDNKAMGTVQDALGLGAAQVDVAYTAMDNAKDILDDIKAKLTAASSPDVDKTKIQEEIRQLQESLRSFAESATFSGGNWLSVNSDSADYLATEKVVASFIRSETGDISLGTIGVDVGSTALFDSAATKAGLVEKGQAIAEATAAMFTSTVTDAGADAVGTAAAEGAEITLATFDAAADDPIVLDEDDAIKFRFALNDGEEVTITVTKATIDTALASTDGTIDTTAKLTTVLTQAFEDAGFTVGATADPDVDVVIATATNDVTLTTTKGGAEANATVSGLMTTDNGNFYDATEIDITDGNAADLSDYMDTIDSMFEAVTAAAAELGSIKSRIDSQNSFVGKLMDALDRGIGQLVDADMEEESTRLQALQVQQQLGIQALSIANGNAQNILSLFRG